MQWYVSQNGKTTGPFDEERLAMLVHWGKISRNAFICDKQLSAWIGIRCSAFARLLPPEGSGGGTGGERPETSQPIELDSKRALGLVAFSVILAGLLMAAL
jgi:hypothetical protein